MILSNSDKKRLIEKYGQWAVVTGASSGIGLELAERLADAGFNLIINARNLSKLQEIQRDFENKFKVLVKIVAGDVAQYETNENIFKVASNLEVGLVVASAGFGTSGKFINNGIDDEVDMLRVNCEGLLYITHYFSQLFAKKRKGGIILLSSMVAFQGVPNASNYAATKAYVQTLAEGLAVELKPFGVDVLAAAPGPVSSGFANRANMQMSMSLKPSDVGVPILKALGRKTTILPGLLTKVLVYSLRTVPRWGKVLIMNKVMGGMTAHQK
jgi:hypothetical protein